MSASNPVVYFITKPGCPRCDPARSLVSQWITGEDITLEEISAVDENLDRCYSWGVREVPAIVIERNGVASPPYCDPVRMAEAIKDAKHASRKMKEKARIAEKAISVASQVNKEKN